jgi:hypothetical protein
MLEKFERVCLACGEVIYSYTSSSCDTLFRIHESKHEIERIRNMAAFDEALKKQPGDYNILKITRVDAGFLKTRGILVDDEMEVV